MRAPTPSSLTALAKPAGLYIWRHTPKRRISSPSGDGWKAECINEFEMQQGVAVMATPLAFSASCILVGCSSIYLHNRLNTGRYSANSAVFSLGCFFKVVELSTLKCPQQFIPTQHPSPRCVRKRLPFGRCDHLMSGHKFPPFLRNRNRSLGLKVESDHCR